MFPRDILSKLRFWASTPKRKPLVLSGARQVGKTSAVQLFAREFDHFVQLNLELEEDAQLFRRDLSIQDLFQAILLHKRLPRVEGRILLFLDEIQGCPAAIATLRYFYESMPELHVIAAGSLLEAVLATRRIGFPVGRVEYAFMYPLTFREFLVAVDDAPAISHYDTIPFPSYAHSTLLRHFHRYTLIGGMPEVVARYVETNDVVALKEIHQSLVTSYLDDVAKYARNQSLTMTMRHAIETAPFEAGKRIKFAGFGRSNYRSREMSEAIKTLERAMLVYLLYPTTSVDIPIIPDLRRSPRLQLLDTGLINYFVGLQGHYFAHADLHFFYKGIVAEHVVGQELMSQTARPGIRQCFWVREKRQSKAEVDFVIQHGHQIVPVEVKAGKEGTLRSLHQFVERIDHPYAVRLYSGGLLLQQACTPSGKPYRLLNLPYFLAGKIHEYLDWMQAELTK